MKKIVCFAFITLTAICMFLGCAKKEASGEKVIKIGVFEPLTGANAAGGALEIEGVRLAHSLFPTVTINGEEYKVDLVIADNKSDKVEAANAVQRLIDSDKVHFILGSWGSGFSIAAGEIVRQAEVPAMGLSCTNPLVTAGNDYYFRTCFIDPFQGTVMANYASREAGAKTAAIVREVSNDYSVGLAKFFVDRFTELGGSIVAEVDYNTGDQDFSAQLTTIKDMNPDVIFAPGNYTESALIAKQARELGITVPFLGGDTWETPELITVGRENVEGVVFSSFFDETAATDGIAKLFVDEYHKMYGADKEIAAVSALGFDGYRVALDAIARANSTDTKVIRDAVAATKDFDGATGKITFDANGDATKDAYIKTVENGKFKFLTIVEP